jgi:predicted metalloprotease
MRLDEFDPSDNVRDLGRGGGGGFSMGGGGGGGGLFGILFSLLPMLLGRKLGCGSILLIVAVGAFFLYSSGGMQLASGGSAAPAAGQASGENVACDTAEELFSCRVLESTEAVWTQLFAQQRQQYQAPTLNFFEQSGQSGCGAAQSAMGPFYCPADQGVYLDTTFFGELDRQLGAAGDAAQAYVIAHEVGHHIQTISGTSDQVRNAQRRASEAEGNQLQVRMELQADCYAGVWANLARTPRTNQPIVEPGDFEEAMRAAQSIGDDTLMRNAGQRPVPESFTHGTSEQRQRWLRRGIESGDPRQCDTFAAASL